MPRRKKAETTPGTERPARTHALRLGTFDRLILHDSVLAFGGGSLREKMQIIYLRRDLRLDEGEARAINLREITPGQYRYDANLVREYVLTDEDYELIRQCFRVMIASEHLLGDQRFDELMFKFFTEDELASILQEEEERASRRR